MYCIRTAIFSMSPACYIPRSSTCPSTICDVMLPTLLDCSIFNHASVRLSKFKMRHFMELVRLSLACCLLGLTVRWLDSIRTASDRPAKCDTQPRHKCWFVMLISIASAIPIMMLKIYKMETSILLKLLTLEWDISITIWRTEVSDGSIFFTFFTLFHLSSIFFRPEFPF